MRTLEEAQAARVEREARRRRDAADYRRLAEFCERCAGDAIPPPLKQEHLDAAKHWRDLAARTWGQP